MNHDFFSKIINEGTAQAGDSVKVHYTGRLDDGTIFDSSEGGEPLAFVIGSGELIPDFEKAIIGMRVGDSKQIQVEPEYAYGERNDNLTHTVNRDQIHLGVEPEVGMGIEMKTPDGTIIPLAITEVTETTVTLDANHPLAGQQLSFAIQLVAINA